MGGMEWYDGREPDGVEMSEWVSLERVRAELGCERHALRRWMQELAILPVRFAGKKGGWIRLAELERLREPQEYKRPS